MNMSYCRFRNTVNDLEDCVDNLTEELDAEEDRARKRMVKLARQIVEAADYGDIPGIETKESDE